MDYNTIQTELSEIHGSICNIAGSLISTHNIEPIMELAEYVWLMKERLEREHLLH